MQIKSFLGIHNKEPARSIPDNALVAAVDIDLTDTGVIQRRPGYALAKTLADITTAYTTLDGTAYVVAANILYRVLPDLTTRTLSACIATAFTDTGKVLFTADGLKVEDDLVTNIKLPSPPFAPELTVISGFLPAGTYSACYAYRSANGLESGTSPIVTVELGENSGIVFGISTPPANHTTVQYLSDANGSTFYNNNGAQLNPVQELANSFPDGIEHLAYHDSRLYVSRSLANGSTVINFSVAFHYHLWNLEADYFIVPGHVRSIKSTNEALIICTEAAIFSYFDGTLTQQASYGVPPGRSITKLVDGSLRIWTARGVCAYPPFTNLTLAKATFSPGSQCSVAIMDSNGISRLVILSDGMGVAYNARA